MARRLLMGETAVMAQSSRRDAKKAAQKKRAMTQRAGKRKTRKWKTRKADTRNEKTEQRPKGTDANTKTTSKHKRVIAKRGRKAKVTKCGDK